MDARGRWQWLGRLYTGAALVWTGTCVLFVLVNLGAALLLSRDGRRAGTGPEFVLRALRAAYPGWSEEDLAELRRESRRGFVPDPLVQLRERPGAGRFVHIDRNGFRHGRDQGPWPPDPADTTVFLLGGSTAFGYGVIDDDTIASSLQQILGGRTRVYNFARGAYYSTQERILFDKLVTLGSAPDLAIFVDGLNDFYFPEDPPLFTAGATRAAERDLARPWRWLLETLPVVRLLAPERELLRFAETVRDLPVMPAARNDAAVLDGVIRRYLSNKAVIEALAAAHGVRVAFVWQPVPTYGYDPGPAAPPGGYGGHERSRAGYPRMRAWIERHPPGPDFLWCADIQERLPEPLYVDRVHYSPALSRRLARCIADLLRERALLP